MPSDAWLSISIASTLSSVGNLDYGCRLTCHVLAVRSPRFVICGILDFYLDFGQLERHLLDFIPNAFQVKKGVSPVLLPIDVHPWSGMLSDTANGQQYYELLGVPLQLILKVRLQVSTSCHRER